MIDEVDLLNTYYGWYETLRFPYTDSRLPNSLSLTALAKLLHTRNLVLTKASNLEKINGRHTSGFVV